MLGDFKSALGYQAAKVVREFGTYLGKSENEKDCYWAAYELDRKFFLALNDEDVWEVSRSDMKIYIDEPVTGTEYLYS